MPSIHLKNKLLLNIPNSTLKNKKVFDRIALTIRTLKEFFMKQVCLEVEITRDENITQSLIFSSVLLVHHHLFHSC